MALQAFLEGMIFNPAFPAMVCLTTMLVCCVFILQMPTCYVFICRMCWLLLCFYLPHLRPVMFLSAAS